MSSTRTTHSATKARKERTFRSGPYLDKLFTAGRGRVDLHLQRQICQRIKHARITAGLTQEDAAALLNVTTRAYQNYESSRVPFRALSTIARITGVSEDWLLRGVEDSGAPLLRDVADGIAALQRSQEDILRSLDRCHERLETLAALLLPAARNRPQQS